MSGWNKSQKGFTIVELLIVVVVIAILAAISIAAYNGIQNRAKVSGLVSDLAQITKAVETYKVTSATSQYPASLSVVNGVNASNPNLTYLYNSNEGVYCIELANGSLIYSVDQKRAPREGRCALNGLIAWLPMNETSNEVAGNNTVTVAGTLVNTPGANGRVNGSYQFGATEMLTVANASALPTSTTAFSVSAWAKGVSLTPSDYAYIVHRAMNTTIGSSVYWLGVLNGGTYSVSANGQFAAGNTSVAQSASVWRMLTLVYDGSSMYRYVDGALVGAAVPIGAITNQTTANFMYIGAGGVVGSRTFSGSIDDVRVYSRALTATEVTNIYSDGAY